MSESVTRTKQGKSLEPSPALYVVSGGKGAAGEQLVQSVLAQYPRHEVPVRVIPDVRTRRRIEKVVADVAINGGAIIHTMVSQRARAQLE